MSHCFRLANLNPGVIQPPRQQAPQNYPADLGLAGLRRQAIESQMQQAQNQARQSVGGGASSSER